MAIFIEQQPDEAEGYPRIVCDGCEQPITDFTAAMAHHADPDKDDPATLTEVLHVHKRPGCEAMICKRLGFDPTVLLANGEELGDHLVLLAARSGVSPEMYADIYDELRQRDIITESVE